MNNWEVILASGVFGLALVLLSTLGMSSMMTGSEYETPVLTLSESAQSRSDHLVKSAPQLPEAAQLLDMTPQKICDLTWNQHCNPPGGQVLAQQ